MVFMTKNQIRTGRRAFLFSLGASVGAGGFALASKSRQSNNQVKAIGAEQRDFSVKGEAPLRVRAANKGLIYGAAGSYSILSSRAEFATCFAQECAILVPENELKWSALRPTPDSFNFTRADWLAEFARDHNMLFRGHTLAWHNGLPKWFKDTVSSQTPSMYCLNILQGSLDIMLERCTHGM
jgi:endo-1,4-beta-xylanase